MHKEFVPPGQIVNENFYCDVLSWLRENVQLSGVTIAAPAPWQRAHPHVTPCAAAFDFNRNDSHPSPSLLTRTSPLWFFPISENEIEAQGATFFGQTSSNTFSQIFEKFHMVHL
jgi:hypothetical protein